MSPSFSARFSDGMPCTISSLTAGLAPSSVIFFSAARSRSMVVTPGATRERNSSRTWRTMRPLWRIRSISDADLQTIAMLYQKMLSVMVVNNPENLFRDLVHRTVAVHGDQSPGAMVVIRNRSSLLLVGRQTRFNHFQPIVIAGHQLRSVDVANFIETGRLE